MKNWRVKARPVLTPHLWYKAMLKVWRKSWESFRIYQLTSTANLVQFTQLWPNWLHLCPPIFHAYFWRSRRCEYIRSKNPLHKQSEKACMCFKKMCRDLNLSNKCENVVDSDLAHICWGNDRSDKFSEIKPPLIKTDSIKVASIIWNETDKYGLNSEEIFTLVLLKNMCQITQLFLR